MKRGKYENHVVTSPDGAHVLPAAYTEPARGRVVPVVSILKNANAFEKNMPRSAQLPNVSASVAGRGSAVSPGF